MRYLSLAQSLTRSSRRIRIAGLVALSACLFAAATHPALAQGTNDWSELQRGLYLSRVGDCAACHTADPEKPMAGKYALDTPFGTIWTANLTPDEETGLGEWSADDFWRAMNEGIRRDGAHLYPAFPYTHFTLISRADSDAIYAYLQSLEPISQDVMEPDFPFPLNIRFVLNGWNLINFEDRSFTPDPERSAAWNRGYYIAEGLGHCSMCHSPKNFTGAVKDGDAAYSGGMAEGWLAPALRPGSGGPGLSDWSKDDLMAFLRHGRNSRTAAFGPMAEVIDKSTRHLTDSDLDALATYILDLPESGEAPADSEAIDTDDPAMQTGALVYATQCSACHGPDGEGIPGQFARLKGSSLTQSSDPTTVVRLVLEGVRSVPTEKYPTPHAMPAFDWKLNDAEVAAVATYVRNAFGNSAPAVTADAVAEIREAQ
ncbi:c-type cytochrome [Pseudohoeflea coraliihabitans]|uniref:Cytochrome c n=1 Tax=Pseudohoeflea coraliihabitans TaxID=2860393 RepID=A0ABS6WLN1_9HYPH|nr:c-type cytochrome [Pseudohoeflea sp. DP4N28-3]MBW3096874.1 cytochrome c [Pseudohoeflea sp. DP4N28-3]